MHLPPKYSHDLTEAISDPTDSLLTPPTASVLFKYGPALVKPRVSVGQRVEPGDVLAARKSSPPPIVIDIAVRLGRPGKVALKSLRSAEGETVTQGSKLVESSGRFGFGHRQLASPVSGVIRSIVPEAGLVVIQSEGREEPVISEFPARVVAVDSSIEVETEGYVVPSCAGAGRPAYGIVGVVEDSHSVSDALRTIANTDPRSQPRILVFQRPIFVETLRLIREAVRDSKPLGVVAPAMPYPDFAKIVKELPVTSLLLTDGFAQAEAGPLMHEPLWRFLCGAREMSALTLPKAMEGRSRLVLLSDPPFAIESNGLDLAPGVTVRTMHELKLRYGTVIGSVEGRKPLESGVWAPAARVVFDDGTERLVAVDNLEILPPVDVGGG